MDLPDLKRGDLTFLTRLAGLPGPLVTSGVELITTIRRTSPGDLKYHEKSRKFVETPDNFWVVIVQPRAKSLRITVYGTPQQHGPTTTVHLKPDMGTYSSFLVDRPEQVAEAVEIINKAKRLKQAGRR